MKTLWIIGAACFLALGLSGCNKKVKTPAEFSSHLHDEGKGFIQTRSVNGVLVSVLYLPPEYLALKDFTEGEAGTKTVYDSLLRYHRRSSSFIITFGPDESKKNTNDIMFDNLNNMEEYTTRALELNFEMENHVRLKTSAGEYAPVLSTLENTYGLSKDRKLNLVFAAGPATDLKDVGYYDVVYADRTFGVGTLHFNFDRRQLTDNLPEVSIN